MINLYNTLYKIQKSIQTECGVACLVYAQTTGFMNLEIVILVKELGFNYGEKFTEQLFINNSVYEDVVLQQFIDHACVQINFAKQEKASENRLTIIP